jgi:hypothetical protein
MECPVSHLDYMHISTTTDSFSYVGHDIGRVRLIFKLPSHYNIPHPLVYIQRFKVPSRRDPLVDVNMFGVKRMRHIPQWEERYVEGVIPLAYVRRTCHLIPQFNKPQNANARHSEPLELFDDFYINSYFDLHFFQLLSV